jgi:uncharacterized protein (TIGR02246 family)
MRSILSLTMFLAAATASAGIHAQTVDCHPTSQQEIAGLFDRWNASLKTGDAKKVLANYAPNSILLPTVSSRPRVTADEKNDYFVHFLQNKPVGTINRRHIAIGCNSAVDAGLYTFTFANGKQVKARYTYTYEWDGHQWLISSHHSSRLPDED